MPGTGVGIGVPVPMPGTGVGIGVSSPSRCRDAFGIDDLRIVKQNFIRSVRYSMCGLYQKKGPQWGPSYFDRITIISVPQCFW